MKKGIEIINILALNILIILSCLIADNIHLFYPNEKAKAHIYRTCTSYEKAICQAVQDIQNGRKYIMLRGSLSIDDDEQKRMIESEKRYNFTYVSLGCMSEWHFSPVYDQIMRRNINQTAHKMIFQTFDKYTLDYYKKQSIN